MITEEQTEKGRQIMSAGGTRFRLEEELGLSERDSYKLQILIQTEQNLRDDQGLLQKVKDLLEDGETRWQIRKKLSLSVEATDLLISKARSEVVDEELKLAEEPALAKANSRKSKENSKQKTLDKVSRLIQAGWSSGRIQQETSAEVLDLEEVKSAQFTKPRLYSKQDKVDMVSRVQDERGSGLDLARVLDSSIPSAVRTIKRTQGRSWLADEQFKLMLAKGTTVNSLMNRVGFQSPDQVFQAVAEVFPDHLIYKKQKDGDTRIILIPNGSDQYDWLKSNQNPKQFQWKVSEHQNYLFVQMSPEYDQESMTIFNLSDVHWGAKAFQKQRFLDTVQMISETPSAFAVLGGDMIEASTKLSVGDPWDSLMNPQEQALELTKALIPVSHKILAYRGGNHDRGRFKHVSTDMAEIIAYYLKVPYFKVETCIDINFGEHLFTIVLDHGRSGNSVQAVLKDAEKYSNSAAFPVMARMSGHVHDFLIKEKIMRVLNTGSGIEFKKSFIIVSGSFLGYTGTYAEESGYAPTPQNLTSFKIHRDGSYRAESMEVLPV